MTVYRLGEYIREEYFFDLISKSTSAVLIYCESSVYKNNSSKYNGIWHMYALDIKTNKWNPLVKARSEKGRIIIKDFQSADGLINSLIRFNYPILGITCERGSGCEIHKNGDIYYRNNCILE